MRMPAKSVVRVRHRSLHGLWKVTFWRGIRQKPEKAVELLTCRKGKKDQFKAQAKGLRALVSLL